MASTLLSGQSVVVFALEQIGVYGVGQTLSASDANTGLRRLNAFVGSLSIQPMSIPSVVRSVFTAIAANTGTYTIGPGATLNTIRPPNGIQAAALLLNSATPAIEIPLSILTVQSYESIPYKAQTNTLWTSLYYNPTFTTSGYGTITLWPIPTTGDNDLVLYYQQPLTEFADLTTQYQVPPGFEELLGYGLALRLAPIYARPVPDDVRTLARLSLANVKRANTQMSDLRNDFPSIRRFGYNITTDM